MDNLLFPCRLPQDDNLRYVTSGFMLFCALLCKIRCASSAMRFVSAGEVVNHWSLRARALHIVHIVIPM